MRHGTCAGQRQARDAAQSDLHLLAQLHNNGKEQDLLTFDPVIVFAFDERGSTMAPWPTDHSRC
jgi:hypothetical protein